MKRRKFIEQVSFITGGLLLSRNAAFAIPSGIQQIKGSVLSDGKGLAGVIVSDGYSVVVTDSKGQYEISPNADTRAVFVSTPAGYEFNHDKGIARHYSLLKKKDAAEINFELTSLSKDDNEHQFLIWADPQVKNDSDVEKMMSESATDVKKLVAAAGPGALIHGITVGDIVWDEHKYYPDYNKAVKKMGIPFFQCLGNHDMDYNKGGDETSDVTFQQNYGPTYYSFNRGQLHYVVMDNVRYLGKDRNYDGFFQQNQLDWLQKDLSFVPKDKLIVLSVHIPVHSGTKNKEALYELLEGRNVHIMSGHTHYHVNAIKDNIYEHNHGTVCGAWWTGSICGDGTPCGYGVYKAKGNELSWHYQSTGEDKNYQFSIHSNDYSEKEKQLQVNIWNYDPAWKTEYFIDGKSKGPLEQFEGFDPLAYATLLGPELPKPRGFAEPRMTDHLFKAIVPSTAKKVKIEATDRFGKKFTATHKI